MMFTDFRKERPSERLRAMKRREHEKIWSQGAWKGEPVSRMTTEERMEMWKSIASIK